MSQNVGTLFCVPEEKSYNPVLNEQSRQERGSGLIVVSWGTSGRLFDFGGGAPLDVEQHIA